MTSLTAWISGLGLVGPGLANWPEGERILTGAAPYEPRPTVLPALECLPAAERRRTGTTVRLALAAGLEATAHAAVAAAELPVVFTSSGGDGQNCHEICQVLASADRQLSPTRFHNAVHNAAAGYWGIATGATPASNALCACDASFAAGLLEALTQLAVDETAVLLIAYDASYPEPIRRVRPIPDAFGVALLLSPAPQAKSLARVTAAVSEAPAARLADARLETLRTGIPAARALPLLERLARRASGTTVIDYLDDVRLGLEVSACR